MPRPITPWIVSLSLPPPPEMLSVCPAAVGAANDVSLEPRVETLQPQDRRVDGVRRRVRVVVAGARARSVALASRHRCSSIGSMPEYWTVVAPKTSEPDEPSIGVRCEPADGALRDERVVADRAVEADRDAGVGAAEVDRERVVAARARDADLGDLGERPGLTLEGDRAVGVEDEGCRGPGHHQDPRRRARQGHRRRTSTHREPGHRRRERSAAGSAGAGSRRSTARHGGPDRRVRDQPERGRRPGPELPGRDPREQGRRARDRQEPDLQGRPRGRPAGVGWRGRRVGGGLVERAHVEVRGLADHLGRTRRRRALRPRPAHSRRAPMRRPSRPAPRRCRERAGAVSVRATTREVKKASARKVALPERSISCSPAIAPAHASDFRTGSHCPESSPRTPVLTPTLRMPSTADAVSGRSAGQAMPGSRRASRARLKQVVISSAMPNSA